MRIKRREQWDNPFLWPETILAAKMIVAGLRRMGEEPPAKLVELAGETNDE